jgi:hypothetical protein
MRIFEITKSEAVAQTVEDLPKLVPSWARCRVNDRALMPN